MRKSDAMCVSVGGYLVGKSDLVGVYLVGKSDLMCVSVGGCLGKSGVMCVSVRYWGKRDDDDVRW